MDDDLILQAAKAMAAKLPALEAERGKKSLELQELTTKINQYRNVIASAKLDTSSVKAANTAEEEKRAGKGSCMADIDSVLEGKSLSATEIQKAIKSQIGNDYGFSTIHSNLTREEGRGRYKNNNGMWSKV